MQKDDGMKFRTTIRAIGQIYPANKLSIPVMILLYFLLLVFSSISNARVARTNLAKDEEPGCYWCYFAFNDNDEFWSLHYLSDYGHTRYYIREDGHGLAYHSSHDLLVFRVSEYNGWCFSYDGGFSYEEGPRPIERRSFEWLPNTDSLIGNRGMGYYSRDTLMTFQQARLVGTEGYYGGPDAVDLGWSPGDLAALYTFGTTSHLDSLGLYFSETYADSFYTMGFTNAIEHPWFFTRGYSPGEYYILTNDYLIFATVDTGRTWEQTGTLLFSPSWFDIESIPGWEPGEFILMGLGVFPPDDDERHLLRYTDYGATVEIIYSTSLDDIHSEPSLPTTVDINCWPNPTNGMLTIRWDGFRGEAITVHDLLGREVYRQAIPVSIQQIPLHLTDLASGTYFVRVLSATRQFTTHRITLIR